MPPLDLNALKQKATTLRKDIVTMIAAAGSGHPGGSLSACDLVTALYFHVLRHDPKNPHWEDRDRFVLSKGHASALLYSALAEAGYFSTSLLPTFRKMDSPLEGHPDCRKLPGVEASTGSLGQGLSIGIGMALAAGLNQKDYRVYVLLGDGESQEGQVWEAAAFAGMHQIDNLVAILDVNGFQLDNATNVILDVTPIAEKWKAFRWDVLEIDGHNMAEILSAFEKTKERNKKPHLILARTVKGKGVSFMENNNEFHGMAPTKDELQKALDELGN